MRKNPMYANVEEMQCGDVLEEISDNSVAEISGGTMSLTIAYTVTSWAVGNKGKICTMTIECMGSGCKF